MGEADEQIQRYAVSQATKAMEAAAAAEGLMTYQELTDQITVRKYPPHSAQMNWLLRRISIKSHGQGRGLLSVVVVDQRTRKPGPGFLELAKELELDADDPHFVEKELQRVYRAAKELDG